MFMYLNAWEETPHDGEFNSIVMVPVTNTLYDDDTALFTEGLNGNPVRKLPSLILS